MKKLFGSLLCVVIILMLAACELPKDTPTTPSSVPFASDPSSSSQNPSVPGTSAPDTAPSAAPTAPTTPTTQPTTPTSAPGTMPPADPTVPTTPASPTTPTTGPAPKPEPEPDFREGFMAAHNAGQKYTFADAENAYEISLNPNTGVCTVLRRQTLNMQNSFSLGPIGCPFDTPISYHRSYYYMGTYQTGADGTFACTFDSFYLDVDLNDLTASDVKKIRDYIWDDLIQDDDYHLTQTERKMWDKVLDGEVAEYICRWKDTLKLSGSASLPLKLTYYDSNGTRFSGFTLTENTIVISDYFSGDSYRDTVKDYSGKNISWYEQHSDGSYARAEYDEQGRLAYEIHKQSDGGYIEIIIVWDEDVCTSKHFYYRMDKVDGLYLNTWSVSVYRYNPADSSSIPISSHRYDRNNQVEYYMLYDEKGREQEGFVIDSTFGAVLTFYTYENDQLAKTVSTDSNGTVTTKEYVHEGGKLISIRVTAQYTNGDIKQWEEPLPAEPNTPSNL